MRSRIPLRLIAKGVARSPDIMGRVLRTLYRKHIGCNGDYRLGTGEALSPPNQISLRITHACNHRCDVCGQYGRHGYLKGERSKQLGTHIDARWYRRIADEVSFYRPLFYVTGGEPFLYPGFMDLMGYIKGKGSPLSVVTNGVLLAENAERIVRDGWDMILVSFDGPRDIHDRCRNFPGAYDTATRGIRRLLEERARQKKARPFVFTSTTISPVNATVLEETFEIGRELGPDLMVVYLSWFTSAEIGASQSAILNGELGVEPFTWRSYEASFTGEQARLFQDAIANITSRSWPFEYMIVPDIPIDRIADYYLDPSEMFGYGKCPAPFTMIDIMPNGDVVTCRDFIDVTVGSVIDEPLLTIWNNEKFTRFRRLLIEHGGVLPQCSRCCGLMGF